MIDFTEKGTESLRKALTALGSVEK
jgi:hypothetical protein